MVASQSKSLGKGIPGQPWEISSEMKNREQIPVLWYGDLDAGLMSWKIERF